MFDATASTDRLIELILQEDKDVFKQLLTTDKVVATKADNVYFGKKRTREERQHGHRCGEESAKAGTAKETRQPKNSRRWKRGWLNSRRMVEGQPRGEEEAKKSLERKRRRCPRSGREEGVSRNQEAENERQSQRGPGNLSGPKIYARVSRAAASATGP